LKLKYAALTLAALAASAHAQSSVTVFGVMDASVIHGSGSLASKTVLFSGGLLGSRIGFRGVEDLGGGMSAGFMLEAGLNGDNGTGAATNTNNQASGAALPTAGGQGLTFNRMSWVSLASHWGEIRLGRDYTPTFMAQALHDPSAIGAGIASPQSAIGSLVVIPHPAGVRASNSVNYMTPKLGAFSGQVMVAMGENASNAGATRKDGQLLGGRLTYAEGPLAVTLATVKINQASVGDFRETIVGANYDFKQFKVWGQVLRDTTQLASRVSGHALAVTVPLNAFELRGGWSRSRLTNAAGVAAGTSNKLTAQGIYNLSRRTAVYSTLAYVRNSDGAAAVPFPGIAVTAPNTSANAVEFGVRHTF